MRNVLSSLLLLVVPLWVQAAPRAAGDLHLLLTLELHDGSLTVAGQRVVALPLPGRRASGPSAAKPWRLRLLSADGQVLHQAGIADPTELRAEFAEGPDGRIRGQRVKRQGPVQLAVRVPALPGRLVLERLDPTVPREPESAKARFLEVASVEVRP